LLIGLEAVRNDDSLIKLQVYDDFELLSLAIQLRTMIGDFIDCLIVASAMSHADGLLTEDSLIHDLKQNKIFRELVKSTNPKFEIRKLSEIVR